MLIFIDYADTTSFVKSALSHNADFAKRKTSSAVLPELNSRVDFVTIDPDSNATNSNPTKNICLPILGREDPMRTLNKQDCKFLLWNLIVF